MIRSKQIANLARNADHPGGWLVAATVPAGVRWKLDEARIWFVNGGGNTTMLWRINDGAGGGIFYGNVAFPEAQINPETLATVAEPGDTIEVLCGVGATVIGVISGYELEL